MNGLKKSKRRAHKVGWSKIVFVIVLFILSYNFYSCSNSIVNPGAITYDFPTAVRDYIWYQTELDGDWGTPSLDLTGIHGLSESLLGAVDGIFVFGIYPSDLDFLYYNGKTGMPITGGDFFFKGTDNSLNTDYNVSINSVPLTKINTTSSGDVVPHFEMPGQWHDSSFVFQQKLSCAITNSAGKTSRDTLSLCKDLFPLTLNGINPPQFDAMPLSVSQGVTLTWGNPDTTSYVTINFLYTTSSTANFIRTNLFLPDNGTYTFTPNFFLEAQAILGSTAYFYIIRYKFSGKYYPEINKSLGWLSMTQAAIYCTLSP